MDDYLHGIPYEEAQQRHPISTEALSEDLSAGKLQIARELDAFFRRYDGLAPSMVISCLREAWAPVDPLDEDCVDRITFDEDINYVDLFETGSTTRRPVTGNGMVVMEVKCAGGYPVWLCDLLTSVGAFPRSFSKYGNAFKRVLAARGEVEVRQSSTGKVSVRNIPLRNRREAASGEILIAPSAGFEVCHSPVS